jgi:hypothetical protein
MGRFLTTSNEAEESFILASLYTQGALNHTDTHSQGPLAASMQAPPHGDPVEGLNSSMTALFMR